MGETGLTFESDMSVANLALLRDDQNSSPSAQSRDANRSLICSHDFAESRYVHTALTRQMPTIGPLTRLRTTTSPMETSPKGATFLVENLDSTLFSPSNTYVRYGS